MRWAKERNWRVLSENPPDFVQKTLVLPCLEAASGVRVDFVFGVSAYERQAIERARREPMGRAQVCFASVEDVLIHKIVAGRPRDLEDARIIVVKQQTIDTDYVRHWLRQFEASLDEKFCERFEAVWGAARGTSS